MQKLSREEVLRHGDRAKTLKEDSTLSLALDNIKIKLFANFCGQADDLVKDEVWACARALLAVEQELDTMVDNAEVERKKTLEETQGRIYDGRNSQRLDV